MDVRTRILRGNVIWELARVSFEVRLIAVGTQKTGFIHGTVYGSASLQLVAASQCPVVIVPIGTTSRSHGIVVGVDDSRAGRTALDFAAREADATRAQLTLIRAWEPPNGVGPVARARSERELRHGALATLEAFAAHVREGLPHLDVITRSVQGRSARVLVDAATESALLVLGNARPRQPGAVVLGSVCHDALMNATSPTAIVHAAVTDGWVTDRDRTIQQPLVA